MSRIDQIREMLADDPADTFLRYALAMELGNQDDNDDALAIYDDLMKSDPPYVPAFFMSGQLLTRIENYDRARTVLKSGIEQAREQNDAHAAGEMGEFLESIDDFS